MAPTLVVGYFVILNLILKKADPNQSITLISMYVLGIYISVIAAIYVASLVIGEAGMVFYAISIVYGAGFLAWSIFYLCKHQSSIHPSIGLALLAYVCAVLYITTFIRENGSNGEVQMQLFNWLIKDAEHEDVKHFILNVAMFVPVGGLYVLKEKSQTYSVLKAISFGIALTTAIETGQLIMRSGCCDIDDMIANVLGAAIGAVAVWMVHKTARERN